METRTAPALPGIVDRATAATASLALSTTSWGSIDLAKLPARIDDETLAGLQALATAPIPEAERCDPEHFARCMKSLDILPRRADDNAGSLRIKLYSAKLGGFSNEALSYLVSKALETCQWFPTIAECLTILRDYPNRNLALERRGRAAILVEREMQHRFNDTMERLARRAMSENEIAALPERWKAQAAERCYLWKWPNGRYTVRADMLALPEEEREAERKRTQAMFAEWEAIEAARVAAVTSSESEAA